MFKQYLIWSTLLFVCVDAESIDKMKVLQIIKAAKEHKSVKNIQIKKDKPIIVYEKKRTIGNKLKKVSLERYGKLLDIPPSSVVLKKMFSKDNKKSRIKKDKTLFKIPTQSKPKGIKTKATKIKFY